MSDTFDVRLTADELRFVISCGSALLLNIPEGSLPTYTHFNKAQIIDFSLRMREQLDQAGYDMGTVRFRPKADVPSFNEEGVMANNLLAEGGLWLQQIAVASPPEKAVLMTGGPDLARRIRSKSVDMQYSKATEFSSDIPLLLVLSAKVALVSGASDLETFEADVYYYKIFDSGKKYVEEYDGFKDSVGKGNVRSRPEADLLDRMEVPRTGNTLMPGMYVMSFFVALVLLAQAFRIVISRIKLHNSLRVYRQKAIADDVCGSYDHILSASLRQITQPWWNNVDSRLPGKAYREAIRAMANRRQVESSRGSKMSAFDPKRTFLPPPWRAEGQFWSGDVWTW